MNTSTVQHMNVCPHFSVKTSLHDVLIPHPTSYSAGRDEIRILKTEEIKN
jgi:hypothetical protein